MCKSNCKVSKATAESVTVSLERYATMLSDVQRAESRVTLYQNRAERYRLRLEALRGEVQAIADKCPLSDEARAYIGDLLRAALLRDRS